MEGAPQKSAEEEIREETLRFLGAVKENLSALEQSPAVKVAAMMERDFIIGPQKEFIFGKGPDDKVRPNVFVSDDELREVLSHPDVKLYKILKKILETNEGQGQ